PSADECEPADGARTTLSRVRAKRMLLGANPPGGTCRAELLRWPPCGVTPFRSRTPAVPAPRQFPTQWLDRDVRSIPAPRPILHRRNSAPVWRRGSAPPGRGKAPSPHDALLGTIRLARRLPNNGVPQLPPRARDCLVAGAQRIQSIRR